MEGIISHMSIGAKSAPLAPESRSASHGANREEHGPRAIDERRNPKPSVPLFPIDATDIAFRRITYEELKRSPRLRIRNRLSIYAKTVLNAVRPNGRSPFLPKSSSTFCARFFSKNYRKRPMRASFSVTIGESKMIIITAGECLFRK